MYMIYNIYMIHNTYMIYNTHIHTHTYMIYNTKNSGIKSKIKIFDYIKKHFTTKNNKRATHMNGRKYLQTFIKAKLQTKGSLTNRLIEPLQMQARK